MHIYNICICITYINIIIYTVKITTQRTYHLAINVSMMHVTDNRIT